MSIRRNTVYNFWGAILPLLVSFITVPVYLELVGEARYGVLAIAWLLLGYFGLFDLGLGRATAQRIATLREGKPEERAQVFWTALFLNLGLGLVGGLLIWPVADYFFGNVFKIEEALRPEIQTAVPWLILAVPIATLSGVLTGSLQGKERFLELNLISLSGTTLFQLLPLGAALYLGVDISILLLAALLARIITMLALLQRCRRHIFAGYGPMVTQTQVRNLLTFGGWVTVTSFVGPMMVILDRFIIGGISGARAVSYYTVPFQLVGRSVIVSNALSTALFPRLAAGTCKEAIDIAREGLYVLVITITPFVAAGIMLMKPFLSWWINPIFAQQSSVVGQVLLIGFWFNSFARIPFAHLQARNRPDIVAKCHLLELIPYLGLLYFGLELFGVIGAAIAFSLRSFVDFVLLSSFSNMLQETTYILFKAGILLGMAFIIAVKINLDQHFLLALAYFFLTLFWAWHNAPSNLKRWVIIRLGPPKRTE